jgi:polysaccharide biosynthesis protein PelD
MKAALPIIEISFFYLSFALINWFLFPHLIGFLDVDPHPFWLGILLFGFRYGVRIGFTAGLCSACLYMMAAWASGETYRFEELNFYILPSFFIIFGVLIGIFTARSREAIHSLKNDKQEMNKTIDLLKGDIQTSKEINQGLEKRIVSRMGTLITLYEGARRLEANDEEELYASMIAFIAKTLQGEEAALYLKDEQGWKLSHKFGWKDFQQRKTHLMPTEGLIGLAGSGDKIVSIRDFVQQGKELLGTPQFMGDAVLAGPLKVGEKGEIVGVVSLQTIPFHHFNSGAMNLFSFLLNWASRSLERARYIQSLREQEVIDPDLQVYAHRYFQRRIHHEFLRSKTYYLPLSVSIIQVPQLEFMSKNQQKALLLLVARLLKESCREMDVVARYNEKNAPFVILWMTANEKQAAEMKEKVLNNFNKIDFSEVFDKIDLKIGTSSFTPKMVDENDLLKKAQEELTA